MKVGNSRDVALKDFHTTSKKVFFKNYMMTWTSENIIIKHYILSIFQPEVQESRFKG